MKVILQRDENVARVVLNRPEALNAMDLDLRTELAQTLKQVAEDDEVRAVILTGAGKGFCSGGDVAAQGNKVTISNYAHRLKIANACLGYIMNMQKPVIAEVNGVAAGIGCGMALACDIIYASEKAKFIEVFTKVGLVSDGGAIFFLSRMLSQPLAKELFFTARPVKAEEAKELGLINRVVAHEKLEQETMKFAKKLANGPTGAYAKIKKLFQIARQGDLEGYLDAENYAQFQSLHSDDHQEGLAALAEKRPPMFTGK